MIAPYRYNRNRECWQAHDSSKVHYSSFDFCWRIFYIVIFDIVMYNFATVRNEVYLYSNVYRCALVFFFAERHGGCRFGVNNL